ncbi:MAG TPA: hypothetical protein VIQ02_09800 [Jiangellaceae bacterium]
MTETETLTTTTAPNGKLVTPLPAADGWTVTAYRVPGALVSKVIAISPDRKHAMHRDKVTDADLLNVAAQLSGTAVKRAAIPTDIMAELSASIDAAKAKKAS